MPRCFAFSSLFEMLSIVLGEWFTSKVAARRCLLIAQLCDCAKACGLHRFMMSVIRPVTLTDCSFLAPSTLGELQRHYQHSRSLRSEFANFVPQFSPVVALWKPSTPPRKLHGGLVVCTSILHLVDGVGYCATTDAHAVLSNRIPAVLDDTWLAGLPIYLGGLELCNASRTRPADWSSWADCLVMVKAWHLPMHRGRSGQRASRPPFHGSPCSQGVSVGGAIRAFTRRGCPPAIVGCTESPAALSKRSIRQFPFCPSRAFRPAAVNRAPVASPGFFSPRPVVRPLDSSGHHRAAFAVAGVQGRKGFALVSAATRICRDARGRVTVNVRVQDMDPATPNPLDNRRIEVVVDGLPLFHGAQLLRGAAKRPRTQSFVAQWAPRWGRGDGPTNPPSLSAKWPKPRREGNLRSCAVVPSKRGHTDGLPSWHAVLRSRSRCRCWSVEEAWARTGPANHVRGDRTCACSFAGWTFVCVAPSFILFMTVLPVNVVTKSACRIASATQDATSFLSGRCDPTVSFPSKSAFLRRSDAVGLEEYLPCPGSGTYHPRENDYRSAWCRFRCFRININL